MIARRAWPALLALLAFTGCRAAGFNNGLNPPEPIKPLAQPEAAEFIERANANAAKVSSLESPSSVTLSMSGRVSHVVVHGDMALERPRNFRMVLGSATRSNEADIGSNRDEFWFLSSREKEINVCEYGEGGESPLAAAMQPDWIIEAMGLRAIPAEEAAEATVKAGANGRTVLTLRRRGPQPGETLIKETILDSATGLVKEHRLLSASRGGGPPILLATATIKSSQTLGLPAGGDGADESVTLPNCVVLSWYQPQQQTRPNLQMEVKLTKLVLNPTFDEDRRASLFTEPEAPAGFARRNLRDNTPMAAEGPATRKSRPIPPSPSATRPGFAEGNGVELGDPMPDLDATPASAPAPAPVPATPSPRPAQAKPRPATVEDLPPLSSVKPLSADAVVGARVPTAPTSY